MPSFLRLVSFAALALAVGANPLSPRAANTDASCANRTAVSVQTIFVGSKAVMLSDSVCSSGLSPDAALHGKPKPTCTTSSATPTPTVIDTPEDVCGEICNTSCGTYGSLPPISEDCDAIKDAIQVFEGSSAPTFVVQPLHIQELVFGTCRYFFYNQDTQPLEYCWKDLADSGSVSETTCFPPTQPINSLAECTSLDNKWILGVSHSDPTS